MKKVLWRKRSHIAPLTDESAPEIFWAPKALMVCLPPALSMKVSQNSSLCVNSSLLIVSSFDVTSSPINPRQSAAEYKIRQQVEPSLMKLLTCPDSVSTTFLHRRKLSEDGEPSADNEWTPEMKEVVPLWRVRWWRWVHSNMLHN